jgi:hypothetical protein
LAGAAVENLVIMKDETGAVYWPLLGMNFIGSLTDGEGYQIKMGQGSMLTIEGALIPSDYEMFMPVGWSYIAYLHQSSFSAPSMMGPVADNLVLLKDGAGSVYWPLIGVNTVGNGSGMMNPGEGYANHYQQYLHQSTASKQNRLRLLVVLNYRLLGPS